MRVLITGVTGFAGSHLAEYLLGLDDIELFGCYRHRSQMDNLDDLRRAGKLNMMAENSSITCVDQMECMISERVAPYQLNLIEADMADPFSMDCLIGGVRPDRIFHLAAQSYVPGSQNSPATTLQLNIMGELNILEAIRSNAIDPLIQIAGSSEEYGLVYPHEVPIKETNPLRPLSPYAVSKVAQEMLALQFFRSHNIKTIVTRGFNHAGPRRGHVFFTSQFGKQIAEVEKGLKPPILYVGDLSSKRDLTDVRDIVRAYWLALEKGVPGETYNVGSGVTWEVGEVLEMMLGMTEMKIEVKEDPARFRPSDVKLLLADVSKFKALTGWEPYIPLEQTLKDELDYWRVRI